MSISVELLLDCIICEVNRSVINVFKVDPKLRPGHSDIPFLEHVDVLVLIQQDPDSDIKFAIANEQGSLNVLLNDESVMLDLVV